MTYESILLGERVRWSFEEYLYERISWGGCGAHTRRMVKTQNKNSCEVEVFVAIVLTQQLQY